MSVARTIVLALCASIAVPSSTSEAAPPTPTELMKERAAVAEKAFRTVSAQHLVGRVTIEAVYLWSVRWLDAALEATPKTARQALADHLKRMADLEAEAQKMFKAGTASSLDTDASYYFRIEAELWSARGKR
jgi:hypothetical protein